ncbi:MAG: hypothetical protein ACLGHQ_03230 [Acidimicrobiia bacterium]
MTTPVHDERDLPEPARRLLESAQRLAPAWLHRTTLAAASRGGVQLGPDDPDLTDAIDVAVDRLLVELRELVTTDVDEQRSNPLSLFRHAVREPTALLLARGARPPVTDPFVADRFPDDVFGLGPASWGDVDPELHEPGITWGAWKAMTVLGRRRDEGLR